MWAGWKPTDHGDPRAARVPTGTPEDDLVRQPAGVPGGTPRGEDPPAPTPPKPANIALAEALDAELAEADAYWTRIHKASFYETVDQLRNAVDAPGWRARDAQKRLARDAALRPGRTIDPSFGSYHRPSLHQVNVKLAESDFEGLKSLAVSRDVPPSTMARILLRQALADAAGSSRR